MPSARQVSGAVWKVLRWGSLGGHGSTHEEYPVFGDQGKFPGVGSILAESWRKRQSQLKGVESLEVLRMSWKPTCWKC